MEALPSEAAAIVARIEGLLEQAEPLVAGGAADEAAYALRETEKRYLPDTLRAYLDVPPARRDDAAREMLIEQLRLLERATAQRLARLSQGAETALAANSAFLRERFGPLESLPEAPAPEALAAPVSTALVRRALAQIESEAGPDPQRILERAAERLAEAFPALIHVQRGGLLGRGPVEWFGIDVPRATDVLRYQLSRARHGGIEASVTRYVRNVKLKTEICDIGEWTQGLVDDLGAYVERERSARDALDRLFREGS